MIQRYRVNYDFKVDMVVEIDNSKMTDAFLHEINNFWSGAKLRLAGSENILEAVLKLLLDVALTIQVGTGYNTLGVVQEFDNKEGWPRMDGSSGIKIAHIDEFEFDENDITVEAA